MARKVYSLMIFLFGLILLLSLSSVTEEYKNEFDDEFDDEEEEALWRSFMEQYESRPEYIKRMRSYANKFPRKNPIIVKSFRIEGGNVIDCVDRYQKRIYNRYLCRRRNQEIDQEIAQENGNTSFSFSPVTPPKNLGFIPDEELPLNKNHVEGTDQDCPEDTEAYKRHPHIPYCVSLIPGKKRPTSLEQYIEGFISFQGRYSSRHVIPRQVMGSRDDFQYNSKKLSFNDYEDDFYNFYISKWLSTWPRHNNGDGDDGSSGSGSGSGSTII